MRMARYKMSEVDLDAANTEKILKFKFKIH